MKNDPSISQGNGRGNGRGSGKRRTKDRHVGEKLRLFSALMWNFKRAAKTVYTTQHKKRINTVL